MLRIGPTTSQDVFKPPENLFQLRYQYRTAPGGGSTPGSIATVTTDQIRLRLDHRIWVISFYPSADIRVNFGDPVTGQTGRLFLPFDARVGRKLNDHTALSFEVGVPIIKDYPVSVLSG